MAQAGKPPDLAVDDKSKASFVAWFKKLEGQNAQVLRLHLALHACDACRTRQPTMLSLLHLGIDN